MAKMSAPPKPRKSQLASAAGGGPLERAAQGELDPVIAALTNAVNAKARASEAAISGYTNDYARQLGAVDAGAPYGPAISQQADVDAALRAALGGGGADLANQLSGRLAALGGSSGAGALGQEAGALSSQGESAGNTRLASGSASLGDLIANMAGARSFSKKLPGLAKLSGLQGIRQAEGNAQQEIAQGTSSAESQLPSIVNEIRGARQQARALKSENAYRSAEIGLSSQRNQIAQFRANTSAAQGQARIGIAQQNANTAGERLQLAAKQAVDRSKQAWARIGISNKHLQLEIAKQDITARSGGLSQHDLSRYHALASSWAERISGASVNPTTGKHEPQLSFKDAMVNAMREGVPASVAFPTMLKIFKQAGATSSQVQQVTKEFAPLDKALRESHLTNLQQTLGALTFGGGIRAAGPAKAIVGLAHQYMGTPYVWGGESPKGFDCSGFAQFLYGKVGINIPRTTYTQWQAGHAVPPNQLAPGDLVFFRGSDSRGGLPGHVGVYIGNGRMIDAPHTGADVRIESVANFGGYMGARRYGKG